MKDYHSKQALMLAIETLSWLELRYVNVPKALADTVKQLNIQNDSVISVANRLVRGTLHRKNILDKIIESVLAPSSLDDFNFGVQSFLRLFTYQTKFTDAPEAEAIVLANLGRSILGLKTIRPVEEAMGKISQSNEHLEKALKAISS